jgi:hypothetical protein
MIIKSNNTNLWMRSNEITIMEGHKMFQELVIKAENGIRFSVNENNGKMFIKAHLTTHVNPIVPYGFEYVRGTWVNGFTIRNKSDGSEFVWVPVGTLEATATLDGRIYDQKFGRRFFGVDDQFKFARLEDDFLVEKNLVNERGGFYISAYLASKENGKLVFKKGMEPFLVKNLAEAEAEAKTYQCEGVRTKLPSGAVYDSIFEWMGGDANPSICEDSRKWGSFSGYNPKKALTGSNEKYSKYGIFDLSGNMGEVSSETYQQYFSVRGGEHNVAKRTYEYINNKFYKLENKGFRIALYVCNLNVSRQIIMQVV